MKTMIILLSLMASASSFACMCTYDFKNPVHLTRAAVLLEIPAENIKVTDYNVYNTPRAILDRDTFTGCGCTRYVRQVYDISFHFADQVCTGKVVYSLNLDKVKVKKINCHN